MRLGVSSYYPLAITSFLCFLLIQKHENRGTSGISLIFPALSPALDVNEPHYSSMSEVSPEEKYWTSMTLPCVVIRKRLSWMLLSEDISQKLGESGFSRVQKFWRIVDVEKVLLSRQENLWMIRFDCFVQDSKNKITNIIKKSRCCGIWETQHNTYYFPEQTAAYFETRELSLLYVAITWASQAVCLSSFPSNWILEISVSESVYFPMMKYVR